MKQSFDPRHGLVLVPVELRGPAGKVVARLALDTGASETLISSAILVAIGYDPATARRRVRVTTASGVEFVPRLRIERLTAIGRVRQGFSVLCHTLPPTAAIDGLLGLDFFRGRTLKIDFRSGEIEVS